MSAVAATRGMGTAMLIHRIDAETLVLAERLSREVADRLAAAHTASFACEDEAESSLWEVVGLLQQHAGVTARILTTAIDVKRALRSQDN